MPISPLRKYKFTSKRFNPCLPTKSILGNISRLNKLPDELLLMVINYLPNSDLLNLRPVNKHIGHIAQEILGKRINQRLKILEIEKKSIETCYQEMLSVKKPQLDHFRQLQFGKISPFDFTMDVKYPFSPLVAFGVALTAIDGKLACE